MGRYLIRRTLFLVLVLFIVSVLTFVIFLKLPSGDPARRAAGTRTTEAQVAEARERLGLNDPIWVQYGRFAKGLVPFPGWFLNEQVYYSNKNFVPVKEEIYGRLPITITLALGAAATWLLLGIPIGIVSAIKRGSFADRGAMIFALFGVSAPVFWLGLVFLYVFWYLFSQMGWPHAPPSGIPPDEGIMQAVLAGRFVMPWLVLALSFAALYSRMTRGNLLEVMGEDYIRTARAKGLSERRVIFKHGLRAALTPIVTMLGLDFGVLLGGAVLTETVFNLPGLGDYTLNAVQTSDFAAVMGVTVFASFFVVIANLIVDVTYAALDPRVRYS